MTQGQGRGRLSLHNPHGEGQFALLWCCCLPRPLLHAPQARVIPAFAPRVPNKRLQAPELDLLPLLLLQTEGKQSEVHISKAKWNAEVVNDVLTALEAVRNKLDYQSPREAELRDNTWIYTQLLFMNSEQRAFPQETYKLGKRPRILLGIATHTAQQWLGKPEATCGQNRCYSTTLMWLKIILQENVTAFKVSFYTGTHARKISNTQATIKYC